MCVVCYRVQRLNIRHLDRSRTPRTNRLSLQLYALTVLLGFLPLSCVILHSGQELVSGSRMCDVFDSDVDSLLDVSVADLLVDDDADGGFGHVVDYTGFAVVDFEWHALLDGTVDSDVDDVTDPVGVC
jgi:hypothetical protein